MKLSIVQTHTIRESAKIYTTQSLSLGVERSSNSRSFKSLCTAVRRGALRDKTRYARETDASSISPLRSRRHRALTPRTLWFSPAERMWLNVVFKVCRHVPGRGMHVETRAVWAITDLVMIGKSDAWALLRTPRFLLGRVVFFLLFLFPRYFSFPFVMRRDWGSIFLLAFESCETFTIKIVSASSYCSCYL